MDLLGLLRELSATGILELILLVGLPLYMRYMISEAKHDLRQEMRGALDDNNKEIYRYMDAKFEAVDAKFEAQNAKLEAHDARFDQIDARLAAHDARFDAQDARMEQLDRKNDSRAYDITLHLIDVRERLANIEGRLGLPTPRMPAVSPPLEAPAEEPSTQS